MNAEIIEPIIKPKILPPIPFIAIEGVRLFCIKSVMINKTKTIIPIRKEVLRVIGFIEDLIHVAIVGIARTVTKAAKMKDAWIKSAKTIVIIVAEANIPNIASLIADTVCDFVYFLKKSWTIEDEAV